MRTLNNRLIMVWSVLLLQIIIFSVFIPAFRTQANVLSILQNSMEISLIAIGVTVVIILGTIDISVGAMLGVLAIITGWLVQYDLNPLLILMTTLAVGFVIGLLNGSLVAIAKIPGLIATIGSMYILRAIIFQMLDGRWLTGIPDILGFLTNSIILGIPATFYIILVFYFFG